MEDVSTSPGLREFREDSWEGVVPSALALYPRENREELQQLYVWCGRNAAVSCWHEGRDESVAMWRLYTAGSEGVAIKTTVGGLMRSLLEADRFERRVARVRYIRDSESQAECLGAPHGLEPVYCKRFVYVHEREVRATLIPAGSRGAPQVGRDLCRGFPTPVDLTTLVQDVIVAERSAVPTVEDALSRAGVSISVRLSAINLGPRELSLEPTAQF